MGCSASSSRDDDTPNQFQQLRSVPEFQAERRALRRARQYQQQHHKSSTSSSASASTSPGTSSLPRPMSPSGDATQRCTSERPAAIVQTPSGSQDVLSTAQHCDQTASITGTTAVVPVAAVADADVQESTILPAKAGVPDLESSLELSATTGHPLPPMERSPMTPVRVMGATSGAAGAVPNLPPMIGSTCLVTDDDAQHHRADIGNGGGVLASTEEEEDDDDTPPTWALTPTHYSGLGSARSWRTEMRLTTRTVSFVGEEDVVTPLARTSSILQLRQQQQQPTDAVCPTPPLRPAAPAAKPACPLLPLPHLPDEDDGDLPPTFLD